MKRNSAVEHSSEHSAAPALRRSKLTAALVARVKSGLPKELLKKALDTLGELEDPAAFEGCEVYLAHREPEVRTAAVRCAGSSKAPGTNKALRAAARPQKAAH